MKAATPKVASLPARLELVAQTFNASSAEARACRQAAYVLRTVEGWAETTQAKLKSLEDRLR